MKAILLTLALATALFTDNPDSHRRLQEQFTTKPSQRITLEGLNGTNIVVRSWEKNEVSIVLDIDFSSSRERDEQRYLDGVSLKKTESNDELRIALSEPEVSGRRGDSFWSWISSFLGGSYIRKEIKGEIYVPVSNPLRAQIKYGTISLDGMKGALQLIGTSNTVVLRNCAAVQEVENDYGRTTVERSGGSLRLFSKSAHIVIDQFEGKVTVDADYSNITANDVSQSLSIHSTSGTIKVDRIGGDLSIRSNYSNITANDISGIVEVEDQSGKVYVKNAYGVKAVGNYSSMEISDISGKGAKEMVLKGQSGTISVTNTTGDLKIENPYGNINLRAIRGNINLRSKSARIEADDITGDWTSESEYSSYKVERLNAKNVSVVNKSGKVDFDLRIVPTVVDIRNEYADVNLELPPGFGGDIDLNVTYGRLESNLPLLKTKTFESSGGYGIRTVGGDGKTRLTVETKSGNVRVMQR